jgi:ribosomal protein S18 acetylase RimI-like enzyme
MTVKVPMTSSLSFRTITGDKQAFLPLILEADPDPAMVGRYLDRGTLLVAYCGHTPACAAVVIPVSHEACELKALATATQFRHRGIASAMIRHLAGTYRGRYAAIIVGTAEPGVPFYEKSGFVWFRTRKDFFVENYPAPVYDGDFLCRDMICLRKPL